MGRPAASVDVQPSGPIVFDLRSKIEAWAATQPAGVFRASVRLEEFHVNRIEDNHMSVAGAEYAESYRGAAR